MTSERIEYYSEELRRIVELLKSEILADGDVKKDGAQTAKCLTEVRSRLKVLALEVGAWPDTVKGDSRHEASNDVLAANIHQALQTWSMIDTCRTAAKNADLAKNMLEETRKAQKTSSRIAMAAVVSSVAAIGSMIAAWIAVAIKTTG